jgi:large subunit ribosomal protein L15
MTFRIRSVRSRLRGNRGGGYGARKKHRGKGSKGGMGMAGTGKKAGQKRTYVLKYFPNYFGKKGFTSRNKKLDIISLDEIQKNLNSFIEKGIAKKTGEGIELNLKGYKVLSTGNLKDKFIIKADAFSENAKEKILKSGSKIKGSADVQKIKNADAQ